MAKTRYEYLLERRERARAAGLCITCCTGKPASARVTCKACVRGARARNITRKGKARVGQSQLLTGTVDVLLQSARQMYVDARTSDSLQTIAQAVHLAEMSRDARSHRRASLIKIHHLRLLERYDECEKLLLGVAPIESQDEIPVRVTHSMEQAFAHAAHGRFQDAYRYFDRAVEAAKEDDDAFRVTAVWENYANVAMSFGDTKVAQRCLERALFVARQQNETWFIPWICLLYASLLARMGEDRKAHYYVLSALSYDVYVPVLEELIARVGIPVALRNADDSMLARCVRRGAIHLAFQSGEPECIAEVATSTAHYYIQQGNREQAQRLLHRALRQLRHAHYCWDLLLAVGQFGAISDLAPARHFLAVRAKLSHAEVAQASTFLFDAFVAHRNNDIHAVHKNATEAIARFDKLGWQKYVAQARALIGTEQQTSPRISRGRKHRTPGVTIHLRLTKREQDVAELVLQGLTNQAIAQALSITERTVESHMTSIMRHLGVRSRHQLTQAFEKP